MLIMSSWFFKTSNGNTPSTKPKPPLRRQAAPKFTLKDVSNHKTQDDLWMVIHNRVYDVTPFISRHPGGVEVLIDCAGVDATEYFEDVGHSEDSKMMLRPLYKGELVDSDRVAANEEPEIIQKDNADHHHQNNNNNNHNNNSTVNHQYMWSYGGMALRMLQNAINIRSTKEEEEKIRRVLHSGGYVNSVHHRTEKKRKKKRNRRKTFFLREKTSFLLLSIALLSALVFLYLQQRKWR
ncbi:hypothetical protein DASC09_050160 [Saccharomycopsis crataegensis]|uniref:Cytochrome b5 heme-binding domain-containing protein n=1 Tax=Saccharomycopsis crataegensis TaxID=43959 RepID=A0AAV5QSI8_9ASCO|nr:hypothetical protein DASC09_050160 [Saccharomycopsis crataegensis]